jgi:Pyridoxamine 5'-phosphate oxidase
MPSSLVRRQRIGEAGPGPTESTFEAVVFDWDGTAVADRRADTQDLRHQVESLCAAGFHLFVVSGTHVGNVDSQLAARPAGPGTLHLCLNRSSEVFEITGTGPTLVWHRVATDAENRRLDATARLTEDRLRTAGVEALVVSHRLNRRKIDIIPDPAWADPPQARIAELLGAVTARLDAAGTMPLTDAVDLARRSAHDAGLVDPRITSDVKHVEIELTDKSDSARWAAHWLAQRGITGRLILVAGDEFGPLGGVAGSDSLMVVPQDASPGHAHVIRETSSVGRSSPCFSCRSPRHPRRRDLRPCSPCVGRVMVRLMSTTADHLEDSYPESHELDRATCLWLLPTERAGRLLVLEPERRAVPVSYVVADGVVLLRVDDEWVAESWSSGAPVAFEVDVFDVFSQVGWSVHVRGQIAATATDQEDAWGQGWIRIAMHDVRGHWYRPPEQPQPFATTGYL